MKPVTPFAEIKRQEKERRENIKQALSDQRHNDMLQIKRQRELNEQRRVSIKQKMLEDKRSKSQSVREQIANSVMRKNEYYTSKARQYQEYKNQEISFQETLKEKKVAEVMALEKMEMDLLTKLKYTQDVERSVAEQFEEALRLPLSEFKNKYLPSDKPLKVGSKRSSTPMIVLNQDTSLQSIQKTDLNQSIETPQKRSQTTLKDRSFRMKEERSSQSLEKNERILKIYGKPKRDRERSVGRESLDGSVNGSFREERRNSERDSKRIGFSRGAYKKFLDISTSSHRTNNETKKTGGNKNRSLLIDIGR